MPNVSQGGEAEKARIMLGLLGSVERDGGQSQRRLAAELGIALGLVNAYLKRCVKKGLVKVSGAPARRYAYYLTPQGFAEKSRLTVEYLSYSFGFFREAKADCSRLLQSAKARGVSRIVLAGRSDLAEIAALCAIEQGVEIAGVVSADATETRFVGHSIFKTFEAALPFDAVLVTDMLDARATYEAAMAEFGSGRVLIPDLLNVRGSARPEAQQ
jgi:DNA-binding MarR family transcriptional regulator